MYSSVRGQSQEMSMGGLMDGARWMGCNEKGKKAEGGWWMRARGESDYPLFDAHS
jgi:hypothetical protein